MAFKINRPKKIILHCSASPDHHDIGLKEIDAWHKARGFKVEIPGIDFPVHCGYHTIFRRDGTKETGRPDYVVGSHAKGRNTNTLGWCWIGIKEITEQQVESLKKEFLFAYRAYKINPKDVIGHCEIPGVNKTCPNLNMDEVRKMLTEFISEQIANGGLENVQHN